MSRFDLIDLSRLSLPDAVEELDFETILTDLKADLVGRAPDLEAVLQLESDPVTKLLETFAYGLMQYRARVNDGVKAVNLATATGGDLDHLAAWYGVARLEIYPADPDAVPPVAAVMEDDEAFRARVQLAPEGFTSAGPSSAYEFYALSSSSQVKDVSVSSPEPGKVQLAVLSTDGNGASDASLLAIVEAAVSAEDVRPLCDVVEVISATILPYAVQATIEVADGPDASLVKQAAENALLAYVEKVHALGGNVALSGIYASLHQAGVIKATVATPIVGIDAKSNEAPFCSSISVTMENV